MKQAWELVGHSGHLNVYRWITEDIRLELFQVAAGDPPPPGTHGWLQLDALLRNHGAGPFVPLTPPGASPPGDTQ